MVPAVIASGAQAVGGMATGAIPLIAAVSAVAKRQGKVIPGFFVRSEPKQHGIVEEESLSAAIGEKGAELLKSGTDVAILEDTVTTARSALDAAAEATRRGCKVVLAACVVERHEGGGDRFRERGIAFTRVFYTDEVGNLYVDGEVERLVQTRD